jgi:molybdenum cofactor biosynthesis enzyme MoaA
MERYINIVDYHQRKNNNQILFDKQIKNLPRCQSPWNNLVINQFGATYICSSPAWLPKSIGSLLDYDDFFSLLNSYEAREIRSEILLNRYSYGNHNICGHFKRERDMNFFSEEPIIVPPLTKIFKFLKEEEFPVNSAVDILPTEICLDFDYTCNFKCPSCRTEMINHNQGPLVETNKLLVDKIKHIVIDRYIKEQAPLTIRWAGGEPFISHAYLELWRYIVEKKAGNIKNIIQTNGSYLKKRSALLENFLPYINQLRISFDAGSSEIYSKVRVNGSWDELLDNCRYVKDVINKSNLKIILSSDFVVQLDNFQDIPQYIEIAKLIGFDKINLSNMWNWGTWDDNEFQRLNISNPTHPKHQKLIGIINPYKNDIQIGQYVY